MSRVRNLEPAIHLSGTLPFEQSIDYARQWIEDCVYDHVECGGYQDEVLPKRVLDLRQVAESGAIQLQEQSSSAEKMGRYACLSYCWGDAPRFVTTTDNVAQRKHSIQLAEMPKTFSDAITVCLALHVEYLWIDALCIIQDSPADWNEQAMQMCQIYGRSYITIIASRAETSHAGFLADYSFEEPIFVKSIPSADNAGLEYRPGFTEVWLRAGVDHDPFSSTSTLSRKADMPTRQRAWCLQEHFMPTRTISFGHAEVVFECEVCVQCQCGYFSGSLFSRGTDYGARFDHYQSIRTVRRSAALFVVIKDHWMRIVENYTSRAMTFDSDRLTALAGIAEAFEEEINCRYLAGLWEDGLFHGLMWETSGPTRRNLHAGVPTWSWASIVGQIRYIDGHDGEIMDYTKVLEVQYTTSPANAFGVPDVASLRISGCLLEVEADGSADLDTITRNGVSLKFSPDASPIIDDTREARSRQPNNSNDQSQLHEGLEIRATPLPVYCWLLGTPAHYDDKTNEDSVVRMLVLKALDEEDTNFRRIGIIRTPMYGEFDSSLGLAPLLRFFEGYIECRAREFSLF